MVSLNWNVVCVNYPAIIRLSTTSTILLLYIPRYNHLMHSTSISTTILNISDISYPLGSQISRNICIAYIAYFIVQ